MVDHAEPFFLFIGSSEPESAASKLKISGIRYTRKRLDSKPSNWAKICSILNEPTLIGVVAKFTADSCKRMLSQRYSTVCTEFLTALSRSRHIVFMHESILTGEPYDPGWIFPIEEIERSEPLFYFDDDISAIIGPETIHGTLSDEHRAKILELTDRYELNLAPYKRNAEMSVLASSFIQENDKKLLFRVYVPSEQMWADEVDKLISLFRDWIGRVKGKRIRQDGYATHRGQVYEFYGEDRLTSELSKDLREFSDFLEFCIEDPEIAARILRDNKVDETIISDLITRYAKQARRIDLDLRQERERKILSIRHQLESELLDGGPGVPPLDQLVESMMPTASAAGLNLILGDSTRGTRLSAEPAVVINQQFINSVRGAVAQNMSGSQNLGPEAAKLLDLVSAYAGPNHAQLTSDVHELEDQDAKPADRLAARQRLKAFLIRVGGKAGVAVVPVLQKYLESKIGV